MINFIHLTRGKSDLISVRGISRRSCRYDLALGELAFERFGDGDERIARARDAHCGVNVASSRKRIADRAADTGRSAAERLYLRRVIVRFVLKEQKIIVLFSVCVHFDFNGTGIDFFRFVQVIQKSALF